MQYKTVRIIATRQRTKVKEKRYYKNPKIKKVLIAIHLKSMQFSKAL